MGGWVGQWLEGEMEAGCLTSSNRSPSEGARGMSTWKQRVNTTDQN